MKILCQRLLPVRPGSVALRLVLVCCTATTFAAAQPSPSSWQGVPAQIIPSAPEVGAPTFTTPDGSPSFQGFQGGSGSGGSGGVYGGGAVYDNLMAQSYGALAVQTAQVVGNNPNAIAAFGQLESGFQNVPTAGGASSATGPWQITSGTWSDYVAKYNLPYTSADRTNPDAQAVVANYILQDYSNTVSAATNQPATVEQAYAAWVFGPNPGSQIAGADPNAPLSNYASADALAKNNMTGMTVGQFYDRVASKVGTVSTQTVRA